MFNLANAKKKWRLTRGRLPIATLFAAAGVLLFAIAASGQWSGDGDWHTVDGGGGVSQGSTFTVRGTAGQPDAGTSSGETYTVRGGFWGGAAYRATAPEPANHAPSFSSTPVETAAVDVLYTYTITATDPDAGDVLTITAATRPGWLDLTQVTSRTAVLAGTPTSTGDAPVVLDVSDGQDSATQAFTIAVGDRIYLPLIVRDW